MSNEVWKKLKSARVDAKIKQKEMAKILGIAPNTLSNYETGKLRISGDYLKRYAEACHKSIDDLLAPDDTSNMTAEELETTYEELSQKAVLIFNGLSPELQEIALDFLEILKKVSKP